MELTKYLCNITNIDDIKRKKFDDFYRYNDWYIVHENEKDEDGYYVIDLKNKLLYWTSYIALFIDFGEDKLQPISEEKFKEALKKAL